MKQKYIRLSLVLLLFATQLTSISASSGRLKGASIVTCNGNTYGNHGDGHWHYAHQDQHGYWQPTGAPIGYENPCAVSTPDPVPESKSVETLPNTGSSNAQPSVEETPAAPEETKVAVVEVEKEDPIKADVTLASVMINKKAASLNTNQTYVIHEKSFDIVTTLTNEHASQKGDLVKITNYFDKGSYDLKVTAENSKDSKVYSIPVYYLPTVDNFKKEYSNVELIIDGKNLKYENDKYTLIVEKGVDVSKLTLPSINYKGKTVTNVTPNAVKLNADKTVATFEFKVEHMVYRVDVALKPAPNSDGSIAIGLGAMGVGGVSYVLFKKNKAKKG